MPARHHAVAVQFLRFGAIGFLGTLWFTGAVYALSPFLGPYVAGLAGYLIAASMNWLMNRYWTFRDRPRGKPHRQWLAFLAANSVGSGINLAIYAILIATVPFCRAHLVVAIAAGTAAGMVFNFNASRRVVFRRK